MVVVVGRVLRVGVRGNGRDGAVAVGIVVVAGRTTGPGLRRARLARVLHAGRLGHDRPRRRVDVPADAAVGADVIDRLELVVDEQRLVVGRLRERLGLELLRQAQRGAGGRAALEHAVALLVEGALGGDVVRLAVALAVEARVRGARERVVGDVVLAGPLLDRRRVERVEGRVVAVAGVVVRSAAVDLEREAEAAGGVVAPVLGRAGGVVELEALLAEVAVVLGHGVAERLVAAVLVDRVAERGEAGRAQHERGRGVVGDQRHHLVARDERLDVARLGLGERARAAVGLDEGVARVGAGAAPQAAVVAVRVDAGLGQAGGGRAVAGLRVVRKAAVLAPVLAAGRRASDDVDGVVDRLVAAPPAARRRCATPRSRPR